RCWWSAAGRASRSAEELTEKSSPGSQPCGGTPAVRPVTGAAPVRARAFTRPSTKGRNWAPASVDGKGMEPRLAAAAYLLTFHTYGTWLPGDPRGTVTRYHNAYGEPRRGPCSALLDRSRGLLQNPPVVLDPGEREVVLSAFQEVCRHRSWKLLAAHVRSN